LLYLGAAAGSKGLLACEPPDQLSLVRLGVSGNVADSHVPHEGLEGVVLGGLEDGALDLLLVDPLLPAALDEQLSASGGDGSSGEGVWDQDLGTGRSTARRIGSVVRWV
jgi:hypothetical protein